MFLCSRFVHVLKLLGLSCCFDCVSLMFLNFFLNVSLFFVRYAWLVCVCLCIFASCIFWTCSLFFCCSLILGIVWTLYGFLFLACCRFFGSALSAFVLALGFLIWAAMTSFAFCSFLTLFSSLVDLFSFVGVNLSHRYTEASGDKSVAPFALQKGPPNQCRKHCHLCVSNFL